MWVCELRDPTTFYNDFLPSALLIFFEERCTGLHAIDKFSLLPITQGYYADA